MKIHMNWFQNLNLKYKFASFMSILLVGFLFIALAYNAVLGVQNDANEAVKKLDQFGSLVDSVETDVLNARSHEKNFLLNKQLEYLEKYDIALTSARKNATSIEPYLVDQGSKNLLISLNNVLESYQNNFYTAAEDQVAVGLDDESGLQGELNESALNLEESVISINNNKLKTSLLTMRLHEKNFLGRESNKYTALLNNESSNFKATLKAAGLLADKRENIRQNLDNYIGLFEEVVDAVNLRNQDIQIVESKVAEMTPLLINLSNVRNQQLEQGQLDAASNKQQITIFFFVMIVLIALISIALLVFLAQGITKPISHLKDVVTDINKGNYDVRSKLNSEDEIGELGKAFDNLLDERVGQLVKSEDENDKLNDSVIKLLQAVSKLSQKDLTVNVPVTEDITGPVSDALNLLTKETAKVLRGVKLISDEVSNTTTQVKEQSDSIYLVSQEEQKEVKHTTEKLDSASKSMNEISNLAKDSSNIAETAISDTDAALNIVNDTVNKITNIRETIHETEKRIKRLGERSQEISGTVNLINNIAERTHILALNASMHAASAGEAGRGFAVVADEVQKLAENSREATAEISSMVNNIQAETSDTVNIMNRVISQVVEGTQLAEDSGKQMRKTQKTTSDLVNSVREISDKSIEQAALTIELRESSQKIQEAGIQTRDRLEKQVIYTEQLQENAKQLVDSVGIFKLPNS